MVPSNIKYVTDIDESDPGDVRICHGFKTIDKDQWTIYKVEVCPCYYEEDGWKHEGANITELMMHEDEVNGFNRKICYEGDTVTQYNKAGVGGCGTYTAYGPDGSCLGSFDRGPI